MDNQDRFWYYLTKKINQLNNLSDDIEIKVLSLNAEGVIVSRYDFNSDERFVTVNVGEDMKLSLFKKSNFKYLEESGKLMSNEEALECVLREFQKILSFTKKFQGYEVFDMIDK